MNETVTIVEQTVKNFHAYSLPPALPRENIGGVNKESFEI